MSDSARYPSSLARHVGTSAMTLDELRELARAAWHQNGTAIFFEADQLNWQDRELINAIATRRHGKRRETK